MLRRILMITTLMCALLGVGGMQVAQAQETTTTACAAGDVYGGCPGFIITPPEVEQGGVITISGQGCAAFQEVVFSINGQVIGTTVSDGEGNFTVTIPLPPSLGPGTYTVVGTCGDVIMSSTLTIRSKPVVNTPTNPLPPTGSGLTFPLLRGALVLLCVGGLILVFAKRRRAANVDG